MSDSSVLGGPYNGHSSKQTVTSKRDGESAITRKYYVVLGIPHTQLVHMRVRKELLPHLEQSII